MPTASLMSLDDVNLVLEMFIKNKEDAVLFFILGSGAGYLFTQREIKIINAEKGAVKAEKESSDRHLAFIKEQLDIAERRLDEVKHELAVARSELAAIKEQNSPQHEQMDEIAFKLDRIEIVLRDAVAANTNISSALSAMGVATGVSIVNGVSQVISEDGKAIS